MIKYFDVNQTRKSELLKKWISRVLFFPLRYEDINKKKNHEIKISDILFYLFRKKDNKDLLTASSFLANVLKIIEQI